MSFVSRNFVSIAWGAWVLTHRHLSGQLSSKHWIERSINDAHSGFDGLFTTNHEGYSDSMGVKMDVNSGLVDPCVVDSFMV